MTNLTVFSFIDPSTFFMVMAASAIVTLIAVQFIDEPADQTDEIMPDGTVQMIDVS